MTPTRTLAAASLTLLVLLAAPAPAFAAYPPGGGAAVVSVACTSTFTAEPGYYDSGESVTMEVAAATEAAAVMSKHTAATDGSLEVTLPTASADAGQYEVTTWGTISPTRGPLVYSPAQECLDASPTAEEAAQPGLPNTGADLSWLWVSGGLVFTGLLALGAAALVRRRSA
ncbi:LPXTG-motif cell wall-anchored protein [Mycetocola sp. CAN_C7]|uniref:LPXTG cell wall anchor domain-containing protein n=1 Tax=Mycetocola sp. CAN_C7 TaxID=2787724 RepID=UPI0018CA7285